MNSQLAGVAADFSNDVWWIWVVKGVAILVFLLVSVLFAIWAERKVLAKMQTRTGPNVHGPFGLLQSLADAMKLLFKEDITVKAADKFVYLLAPLIAVFSALLVFAVIPFGPEVNLFGIITPLQLTDCRSPSCTSSPSPPWACTGSCSAAGRPARRTRCWARSGRRRRSSATSSRWACRW